MVNIAVNILGSLLRDVTLCIWSLNNMQNMKSCDCKNQSQSTLILILITLLLGYTVLIPEELSPDIKLSK